MLTMISGILFLQSFLIHIDLKEQQQQQQQQQQKNKKQKRTGSIVLLNNGDTSKICTKNLLLLLYKKSFSWATICLFYFSFLRCWLEVKDSC